MYFRAPAIDPSACLAYKKEVQDRTTFRILYGIELVGAMTARNETRSLYCRRGTARRAISAEIWSIAAHFKRFAISAILQ